MSHIDTELLTRLESASLLPPDDREREAATAAAEAAGPIAREAWACLVAEVDVLRTTLAPELPTAATVSRLRAIPETAPRVTPRAHRPRLFAAAALVAAGLLLGFLLTQGDPGRERAASLARAVAADHVLDRHITLSTADPDALAAHVRGTLPFSYALPDLAPLALVGGRCCSVGGEPVAFTLLRAGDEPVSLFQFVPDALGVAADHAPRSIRVDDVPGSAVPIHVLVWCENGAGYALVGSDPALFPK